MMASGSSGAGIEKKCALNVSSGDGMFPESARTIFPVPQAGSQMAFTRSGMWSINTSVTHSGVS
jgi:hypothetical protein